MTDTTGARQDIVIARSEATKPSRAKYTVFRPGLPRPRLTTRARNDDVSGRSNNDRREAA